MRRPELFGLRNCSEQNRARGGRIRVAIEWTRSDGGIEVATARTAAEFIEALRPSNPHWWEADSRRWIFRGHAKEDWQLLPSAWQ
jgi:hypothetical protein